MKPWLGLSFLSFCALAHDLNGPPQLICPTYGVVVPRVRWVSTESWRRDRNEWRLTVIDDSFRLAHRVGGPALEKIGFVESPIAGLAHIYTEGTETAAQTTLIPSVAELRQSRRIMDFIEPRHTLAGSDLETRLAEFYLRCLQNRVLPPLEIDWKITEKGLVPLHGGGDHPNDLSRNNFRELNSRNVSQFLTAIIQQAETLRDAIDPYVTRDPRISSNAKRKFLRLILEGARRMTDAPKLSEPIVQHLSQYDLDFLPRNGG